MFKEHEKFWAFFFLLLALVFLSWMSVGVNPASNSLRDAIVGVIGILGVASQSLFRVNENAKAMNELLRSAVEKGWNSIPIKEPTIEVPRTVQDAADQVAEAATAEANKIAGEK